MKMKNMAMAVMALAVSAMAGSAFALEKPSKPVNSTNTVKAQLVTMPALSLEQMAKEKGISVEELIAQLKKEGTLALKTISLKAADAKGNENETAMLRVFRIEDMAKEQGISVEELIANLQKEGKLMQAATLVPATPVQK